MSPWIGMDLTPLPDAALLAWQHQCEEAMDDCQGHRGHPAYDTVLVRWEREWDRIEREWTRRQPADAPCRQCGGPLARGAQAAGIVVCEECVSHGR